MNGAWIWMVALGAVGCGSDGGRAEDVAHSDGTSEVATEVSASETVASETVGETAGPGTCDPPMYGGGEPSVSVTSVDVHVSDAAGTNVSGVLVQVCGTDLCMTGTSGADGHARVNVNHALRAPVVRVGDGLAYVKLARPITAATTALEMKAIALPAVGAPLAAGTKSTSGEVAVAIAAGATVLIDTLSYDTAEAQAFRAVSVPLAAYPADAAPSEVVAVFGVAPVGTEICPRAAVTVPNTAHLAAGSAVEFWVHGTDVGQAWAPWGGWARASDGVVSADGATIATAADRGFAVLETFAVRTKP